MESKSAWKAVQLGESKRLSAYEAADQGQSPQADWAKRLITLGHRVRLSQSGDGEILTGVAESVDDWGRLIVRDDKGRIHAYPAGDVTLQVDNSRD